MLSAKILRSVSLQSFEDYRLIESRSSLHTAVTDEGTLLDHSVLELRVNPPNVDIDNKSHETETIITIDSANRPGTLVEVAQCLTEINLIVRSSQISSDGGWFVDDYECERQTAALSLCPQEIPVYTVFELAGKDRVGFLHETTFLLAEYYFDIKSLAAWTQDNWGALVIGAILRVSNTDEAYIKSQLDKIKIQLLTISGERGYVKISEVSGYIHHERRLHRLLLKEAESSWREAKAMKKTEELESHMKKPDEFDSPEVKVIYWPRLDYWRVNICCRDRRKLLFDTVCTLADLDYEVYHATVTTYLDIQIASQDFYIRPRFGDASFKPEEARKLVYMLISSIRRRFPRGLKVHVLTLDEIGFFTCVAKTFRIGKLCVTRAKVKRLTDEKGNPTKHAVHTFYVLNEDKSDASPEEVIKLLTRAGGHLTNQLTEEKIPARVDIKKDKYYFNVVQRERQWDPKNKGGFPKQPSDYDGSL